MTPSAFLSRLAMAAALLAVMVAPQAAPAADTKPAPAADTKPAPAAPSAAVRSANDLIAAHKYQDAIALLEPWVKDHPEDSLANETLLSARVDQKQEEIRRLLAEEALTKGLIVGDPDYEAAKARADKEVRQRLDIVEYYVAQKQYGDAAALCTAILHDFPHDEATLALKFRILEALVATTREELIKDQQYRHGEGINDVVRDGTFWRDPPKIPRTVWIFDEDIEAAERAAVDQKLKEKVTLIYDGTNGTQSAQVREVLGPLFAYIGINYVILDDALGSEKLTIHLVDESVGNALATIAKIVKVRFNYSGGTVYVTNQDSEVMITRIIRLKSGLTDVDTQGGFADFNGGTGSNMTGGGGGIGGNGNQPYDPNNPNAQALIQQALAGQNAQQQQAQGQNGQNGQNGQQKGSDLEKFLKEVPKIVEGWPDKSEMYLDRKSNTLYVHSTPSAIAELQRLLDALDYNNVQVLIETRFLEVSETAARELGIDWSGGGQRGALSIGGGDLVGPGGAPNPSASGATIGTTAASLPGAAPPANGLFGTLLLNKGVSLAAKISALEQQGKADTLSEPKILTLNNSTGKIAVTQDISYIDSYTNDGTGGTYPVTGTNGQVIYQQQPAALVPHFTKDKEGITLSITPSVAQNSDIITLAVSPSVRELTKAPQTQSFNIPVGTGAPVQNPIQSPPEFSERKLFTMLHVENGQTVALGGLTKEREERDMAGVPFLSRVPLLGHLFRRDSKQSDRRNLVILVTAHIVHPNGSQLSDEVQHLRDTAKVIMPEAALEAEAARDNANPNGQTPAEAPAAPRGGLDTPWSKGGR